MCAVKLTSYEMTQSIFLKARDSLGGVDMRVRKVPLRMCLGCQEMKPKKALIRVVRTPENVIDIDSIGKQSGRGAYICPDEACFTKAVKAKRFEKAFQQTVPKEVVEKLKERLVSFCVPKSL